MDSYSLRNGDGALAAFGQSYEREGRGHLARLCYTSLGFVVRDYPVDAPWPDKCFFLTRRRRSAD